MAGGDTIKQIARWTALGALFLVPLTPLIVSASFFFPFITPKAFYFRTLVEVLVAAWTVLACMDVRYRPRFSWIGVAVLSFVLWMFVADAFAINAVKAFWSNFERMEGWVLLVHLLGFFYAAGALLRVEKKWRAWFLTSLAVSVIIAIHACMQLGGTADIHQGSTRVDASMGNSAYLAIYLLFNVYVALWLALTEKYAWLKWSLIVLAIVEATLIFFTETRGTVIGLILGFALAALLTAVTAGKRARRFAAGGFALIVLLVGSFYLARNSSFVQGNHVLQRVASISLNDGQTRFTIWHMAWQGVLEKPIIGWGQEGFNYVFDKYYDPALFHQEPWFDRAHNAFIDWLTAGGIPAFLLYLSLFGSAFLLLWRSSELSRPERIALTAALVGYAVHNLFVFDNLYSYVYFFALLALIDSQVSKPIAWFEQAPVLGEAEGATYALPIALVVFIGIFWFVNVPGMQTATGLITALNKSDPSATITAFQELTQHPTFAIQEVREQLINVASSITQSSATNEQKQQILTLAATEMNKQVEAYPLDTREWLELSYVFRAGGDLPHAMKSLQTAAGLSPKKEDIWVETGSLAWDMDDPKTAQTAFHTAYQLGPQFTDLATYAAAGDIAAGDTADGDALLKKTFGTIVVDDNILGVAYYRTKNWPRLIALWKLRTESPSATAQTWLSLAAAYYTAGDKEGALKAVTTIVTKYPTDQQAQTTAATAIAQLKKEIAGQ